MPKAKKEKNRAKRKTVWCVLAGLLAVLLVVNGAFAVTNVFGMRKNRAFVKAFSPVAYQEQLHPTVDAAGRCTFETDRDFKILHLTDIHIGGGFMCFQKDRRALDAVAAMVTAEQPDLVVITGDLTYPVPVQAGTLNNKSTAKLLAQLFEELGVYWAPVLGNHDAESYSYFLRAEVGAVYESDAYPHCLFQSGQADVDGVGNYCINIQNTAGEITQSLMMLDSNAYAKGNIPLLSWKYDGIHPNQIAWYEQELQAVAAQNNGVMPKSLAFFHIPLQEMQTAYYAYRDNNFQNTEEVVYHFGRAGEVGEVVYPGVENSGFFEKARSLGSTQGIFFGHDHLNNLSLTYQGIRMTYGKSIDYLAYGDIDTYGNQRGCTVISVRQDGSFSCEAESYYQEKYRTRQEKEAVTMEDYYAEELQTLPHIAP